MMAPGGIVAYSGAQKDIIEYFQGLGFQVIVAAYLHEKILIYDFLVWSISKSCRCVARHP